MGKRIFASVILILFILAAAYLLTNFGMGYRFDFGKKILTTTGILALSSSPQGASIYINDKLTSATNTSINIVPDWYDIRIEKEGYIPWRKRVPVKGEIVTKAEALLLPQTPSLKPLTTSGVLSPVLSPSRNQIAYIVPFDATPSAIQKGGIYVWNLTQGPLNPLGNSPQLLARSTNNLDFTNSTLIWSPDEKQIAAAFFEDNKILTESLILPLYILETGITDQIPTPAYSDSLNFLLSTWEEQESENTDRLLASLPLRLSTVLEDVATNIELSEDENKILYQATGSASLPPIITPPLIGTNSTPEDRNLKPDNIYIYDLKEDKNFLVKQNSPAKSTEVNEDILNPDLEIAKKILRRIVNSHQDIRWYPDSNHFVMLENGTIYITEYDGLNKTTVYAGPLEDSYVFPWPSGGRILILTNYNKAGSASPNLYAVDLR
ncbi:hypothetical protein A2773_05210 [Candidatus Gottesmanbacteria bacterium RIFCSPHIGHO2_01_FULL_39_10]|uniref:PEGA domain-containing protein n=1 Tax=Candidatus Gottesmanbacteria bacterium RIFCSPHIGHO2_01_FULL_39_10 TaxID=1798375 RepID=A0A1F5ZNX4_9BACT|nr:MAG: hypothetical protein A2773_05210 [Candidatus Gottesmanbacteria bacterium RIFCSPHIGHO2_01_FULL_39_10]